MHNYYFKIEVKGRGRFPLDQLRRYEMFPINIETTQAMEDSFGTTSDKRLPGWLNTDREYTLGMYASSLSADNACIDRFRSFGFIAKTKEVWKNGELFEQDGEIIHTAVEREEKLKLSGGINWETRS